MLGEKNVKLQQRVAKEKNHGQQVIGKGSILLMHVISTLHPSLGSEPWERDSSSVPYHNEMPLGFTIQVACHMACYGLAAKSTGFKLRCF